MHCPKCSHSDTKVIESRLSHEGKSVRRRRSCASCNFRFTTYEREEEVPLQVKKRDGKFQSFNRKKIINALQLACIKRPISVEEIENAVANIEQTLRDSGERVFEAKRVGDLCMDYLQKQDQIAYVRFASIYKDFKDPEEFAFELKGLR